MLNESYVMYLPADCTGEFQPIDISMNNPVKTLLKDEIGIYVEFLPKLIDDTTTKQSDAIFKP